MLQKNSFGVKLITLIVIFSCIFFIEINIYKVSINDNSSLMSIVLQFVQVWVIILFGYFFFKIFKYFRLPKVYYKLKKFETENYFKNLGVERFRHILVHSFFKHLNQRVYLKGRGGEYVKVFYEETKRSETSHLFTLIITIFVQFQYLLNGKYLDFICLSIFSILFNLYPIFLQRKSRFVAESKYNDLIE